MRETESMLMVSFLFTSKLLSNKEILKIFSEFERINFSKLDLDFFYRTAPLNLMTCGRLKGEGQ